MQINQLVKLVTILGYILCWFDQLLRQSIEDV